MIKKKKIEVINSSSHIRLPIKKVREIIELCLNDNFGTNYVYLKVIYLDDKDIQDINKKFLNHDYPTDVITFSLEEKVECEVYLGIDTIKFQAIDYKVSFEKEILRCAVHGALHFAGFDDASKIERARMHEQENYYLRKMYNED